ncbi:MAG: glycerophosphodiester phosphodiesterase [Limisphaerales bacterium]
MNRSTVSLAFSILTFIAMSPSSIAQTNPAPPSAAKVLSLPRPLVIGHRGFAALAPENTLASFRHALVAGADLVELDYHHSRDDVPIVIHDATLDRTTDAVRRWNRKDIRVDAHDAAELVTLPAGSEFQPPFPGERLPTLLDALEFIQGRGITLIERKGGDASTLADLLRQRGLVNQVVVQAFDWEFLRAFHQLVPDQILGALGPPSTRHGRRLTDAEKALGTSWLSEIKALGAQVAVWNRQVDRAAVLAAHELGLKVWVYTINDADLANALVGQGVDGIITDNPSIVWRGFAVAASTPP